MKKTFASRKINNLAAVMLTAALISSFLFSCKTMQEDILVTEEENNLSMQAISEIEEQFIFVDAECYQNKSADSGKINSLISEIQLQKNAYLKEPSLLSRLTAFEGLLEQLNGKTKKAQDALEQTKKYSSNDIYVILLETRLIKSEEERTARLEELLAADSDNAMLLLEKGKLLFDAGKYKDTVAVIDNALISFDRDEKDIFRKIYTPLRNNAWDLFTLNAQETGTASNKSIPLTKNITLEDALALTQEQTSLLESFSGGQQMSVKDLKKRLEKSNYFSAATDPDDEMKTSLQMIQSSSMSRILCARFLWTLFVQNNGGSSMLTKYSDRYSKKANAKSPIPDVDISNPDFDAVLGTVENEIIDLPDGINFQPDADVTAMEYIKWLQNTAK